MLERINEKQLPFLFCVSTIQTHSDPKTCRIFLKGSPFFIVLSARGLLLVNQSVFQYTLCHFFLHCDSALSHLRDPYIRGNLNFGY